MSMPPRTRTGIRLDSRSLRVLAHPLRSRLLSALRMHGPATATDLAERLATNSGATSYHLRQLAEVGLVEDTDQGVGRRREWRATTESHSWLPSDFAGDPDAQTALSWLTQHYAYQYAERYAAWAAVEHSWPPAWRDAVGVTDHGVHVTAEQLRRLNDELDEVLERYRQAGAGDPDARRVLIARLTMPRPEDRPPGFTGGES